MFPNNWKTTMFIHVIFLVFDFNRKKNNQPKRKLVYFAIKGNECLAAYIPLHSEFKLQMIKHTQKSRCAQTSRAAQTRSVYLECGRQSHYHNFIWNRTSPSGLSALQSFGMAIWCGVPTFDTHTPRKQARACSRTNTRTNWLGRQEQLWKRKKNCVKY